MTKAPKYVYWHGGIGVRCSLVNMCVKNKCAFLGTGDCKKCKVIRYVRDIVQGKAIDSK